MKLAELNFGAIDAKYELLSTKDGVRQKFSNSIFCPPNFSYEEFLERRKFFIYGPKGSGKTAILHHLAIEAQNKNDTHCEFILFKEKIGEITRRENGDLIHEVILDKKRQYINYEVIWKWFLLKKIREIVQGKSPELFDKDETWNSFCSSINAAQKCLKAPKFEGIIPEFNISLAWQFAKFAFKWQPKIVNSFYERVNSAYSCFTKLTGGEGSASIFLDEIELSNTEKIQYEQDSLLIRDLIIVVGKMNEVCIRNNFKIGIYAAIRNEVLNAPVVVGKEINKTTEHFGFEINWNQNVNSFDHPIISVLKQRIIGAEISAFGHRKTERILETYFPSAINSTPTQKFIIELTWMRPRDIIRLLLVLKERNPAAETFSDHLIRDALRAYAEKSWTEIEEDLNAKYNSNEIAYIKKLLLTLGDKFLKSKFDSQLRLDKSKNIMPDGIIESLTSDALLHDLYRVGVIGHLTGC